LRSGASREKLDSGITEKTIQEGEAKILAAQIQQQNPGDASDETETLKSSIAWACTVYSLVPYIGILFIPLAVVFGGIELIGSHRIRRNRAWLPLVLSAPILAAQLVLWWLLYLIPEIGL
jgi:hypothetical protein